MTSSDEVEYDDVDYSVTRPLNDLVNIFRQAKLKRISQCKQTNFPSGIYPVYMFALIPIKDEINSHSAESSIKDETSTPSSESSSDLDVSDKPKIEK